MLLHQLENMKVKELREYIEAANLDIENASKKKKNDLVIEIIMLRDKRQKEDQAIAQQMEYLELEEQFQMEVENEIAAQQKEENRSN